MQEPKKFQTAVIVGRWQLFHKGHETLLRAALVAAEQVIVVIGSSFRSRDVRNPFNWQERQAMIEASLSEADRSRVLFLPVRDYFDDNRWNTAVRTPPVPE
jgi:bifunctional NMN adenylyltransferase/nudix hydrolase